MPISDSFAQMIEDNGLPIPPVPLSVVESLDAVQEHYFATDMRPLLLCSAPYSFENMDFFLDEATLLAPELAESLEELPDDILYVGCGLLGHGIQSWRFFYSIATKNLRVLCSYPWTILDDQEEQRARVSEYCELIRLCQMRMAEDTRLELILDQDTCRWRIRDLNDDTDNAYLHDSEGVPQLLDHLCDSEDIETALSRDLWIRI